MEVGTCVTPLPFERERELTLHKLKKKEKESNMLVNFYIPHPLNLNATVKVITYNDS